MSRSLLGRGVRQLMAIAAVPPAAALAGRPAIALVPRAIRRPGTPWVSRGYDGVAALAGRARGYDGGGGDDDNRAIRGLGARWVSRGDHVWWLLAQGGEAWLLGSGGSVCPMSSGRGTVQGGLTLSVTAAVSVLAEASYRPAIPKATRPRAEGCCRGRYVTRKGIVAVRMVVNPVAMKSNCPSNIQSLGTRTWAAANAPSSSV